MMAATRCRAIMDTPSVNLQTLVAAVMNAVQAINGLNQILSTAFPAALTSSATYDPPSIPAGTQDVTSVTVAGAVLGNYVDVSFGLDLSGVTLTAYVSSSNIVTVIFYNGTAGAIDLASGIISVAVRNK